MKKLLKENYVFIIVVVCILLFRIFVASIVRADGRSMNKTFNNGDLLILYKLGDINRNDVVVISKNVTGEPLIKRVIGLPGDTVSCENGKIYINYKLYDDKYGYGTTSSFDTVKLAEDEYFVLGDNREISKDSRYIGNISKDNIKGKCIFQIFPFKKFGLIKQSN